MNSCRTSNNSNTIESNNLENDDQDGDERDEDENLSKRIKL